MMVIELINESWWFLRGLCYPTYWRFASSNPDRAERNMLSGYYKYRSVYMDIILPNNYKYNPYIIYYNIMYLYIHILYHWRPSSWEIYVNVIMYILDPWMVTQQIHPLPDCCEETHYIHSLIFDIHQSPMEKGKPYKVGTKVRPLISSIVFLPP